MLKKRFIVICLFAAIFLTGIITHASDSQNHKLEPVNERKQDQSFESFSNKLVKAVNERDEYFIADILHPEIECSYPEKGIMQRKGSRDFLDKWQLENEECSRFSPLWDEFSTILSIGGTFSDKNKTVFEAPYVYSRWPENTDGKKYWAITGKHINLRQQPDMNADVIAQLSYNIVRVSNVPELDSKWEKIIMQDGRQGYVLKQFIRSRYDYSATFVKVKDNKGKGKWLLKKFIGLSRERTLPPPD